MNGYQLMFYTGQNRRHGHQMVTERLLHGAKQLGIHGATVVDCASGRRGVAMLASIAATAVIHDLTVVTRNVDDFAGTGARVLNPFKGSVRGSWKVHYLPPGLTPAPLRCRLALPAPTTRSSGKSSQTPKSRSRTQRCPAS